MRSLAELERLAKEAVQFEDLVFIAAYADFPSTAYEAADALGWFKRKVASCRFMAIIMRDYGKDAFWDFVSRNNQHAHKTVCRCQCHDEKYGCGWFLNPDFSECDCCGFICLSAAHTFGTDCAICCPESDYFEEPETDEEGETQDTWITVSNNPADRVERVSKRLFKVVGEESDITILRSNVHNAYANGTDVKITDSMLKNLNDDELAFSLGHEIAHNRLRHIEKSRAQQGIASKDLTETAEKAKGFFGALHVVATGISWAAINRHYNRVQELEADRLGLEIASKAGYSRDAGRSFYRKYWRSNQGILFEIFSTHPTPDVALRNLYG